MNRLRELRISNNWRQEDLAQKLNTKRQTVARYENGERGLDIETIVKLCDIFGCTADYLLCRSTVGSLNLTMDEESLILAHRRADSRAKEMVRLALEPFWQDGSSAKVI